MTDTKTKLVSMYLNTVTGQIMKDFIPDQKLDNILNNIDCDLH